METIDEGDRETLRGGHRRAFRGAAHRRRALRVPGAGDRDDDGGGGGGSCSTASARSSRARRAHEAYLPQICGTIKWRLNNKSAAVRQQAADLISRIAIVMRTCNEEQLWGTSAWCSMSTSARSSRRCSAAILGALKAIVNVIGMSKMTPPIKDLLPRLTPILKNRHETVQENCIDLVGRIADRGAEFVSAREWMRICFELLEMLKAHKKAIRRATVNTFGYIAKAIGPQDVLATLLNNLKVQERQNRVCTTVAIAIVAETCAPFTVLPALMNEYRVPELNVQNGVLKSLSFLFEYVGEMGKDYIVRGRALLEDALMDRDQVHRQTAAVTVKHLALGSWGSGARTPSCICSTSCGRTSSRRRRARHQRGDGRRGGCRVALGSGGAARVPAAGPVPSRAQGARDVLEGVQQRVHRGAGSARPGVPGAAGRRRERVPKA